MLLSIECQNKFVFNCRFDSEMRDDESTGPEKNVSEGVGGKCVSVEDLNDALKDDTEDSEAEVEKGFVNSIICVFLNNSFFTIRYFNCKEKGKYRFRGQHRGV